MHGLKPPSGHGFRRRREGPFTAAFTVPVRLAGLQLPMAPVAAVVPVASVARAHATKQSHEKQTTVPGSKPPRHTRQTGATGLQLSADPRHGVGGSGRASRQLWSCPKPHDISAVFLSSVPHAGVHYRLLTRVGVRS